MGYSLWGRKESDTTEQLTLLETAPAASGFSSHLSTHELGDLSSPPHPLPLLTKEGLDQWHVRPPAHRVHGQRGEEHIRHPAPAQILRKHQNNKRLKWPDSAREAGRF